MILFCVFLTFLLLSESSFTAVVLVCPVGGVVETCCLLLIFYRNSITSDTQGKHKYMNAHMHRGPKRYYSMLLLVK